LITSGSSSLGDSSTSITFLDFFGLAGSTLGSVWGFDFFTMIGSSSLSDCYIGWLGFFVLTGCSTVSGFKTCFKTGLLV
jgi:hypothetical protein